MSGRESLFAGLDGVALIAAERERQITDEGWTEAHDETWTNGELVAAAVSYAIPEQERSLLSRFWPWTSDWWKPTPADRVRELVKAGALIAAEIDRLQRKADRA